MEDLSDRGSFSTSDCLQGAHGTLKASELNTYCQVELHLVIHGFAGRDGKEGIRAAFKRNNDRSDEMDNTLESWMFS